jgi:hypothetical protein
VSLLLPFQSLFDDGNDNGHCSVLNKKQILHVICETIGFVRREDAKGLNAGSHPCKPCCKKASQDPMSDLGQTGMALQQSPVDPLIDKSCLRSEQTEVNEGGNSISNMLHGVTLKDLKEHNSGMLNSDMTEVDFDEFAGEKRVQQTPLERRRRARKRLISGLSQGGSNSESDSGRDEGLGRPTKKQKSASAVPSDHEERRCRRQTALKKDVEDDQDPPFRVSGHEYLGRQVLHKTNCRGCGGRTVLVEQIGKVIGWISENDVDSAGEPGFVSESTGQPAKLFRVEFPDYPEHPHAAQLMHWADLEEQELRECLMQKEGPQLDDSGDRALKLRPVIYPEDRTIISEKLYLVMEQLTPCKVMEADLFASNEELKLGFPGLACRHCLGHGHGGRFFPASETALYHPNMERKILRHLFACFRCPIQIQKKLQKLFSEIRKGKTPSSTRGGRHVFVHRLWCRIHDIPLPKQSEECFFRTKRTKRNKRDNSCHRKPLKRIPVPLTNDVLSVKGGSACHQHPGNVQFREWVNKRKHEYNATDDREQRALICRQVIAQVIQQDPPGRFLLREGSCSWWVELDDARVMEKTRCTSAYDAPCLFWRSTVRLV